MLIPQPCRHRQSPYCKRRTCMNARGAQFARNPFTHVIERRETVDATLDREWRERVEREA
jgi:hypothetical protein